MNLPESQILIGQIPTKMNWLTAFEADSGYCVLVRLEGLDEEWISQRQDEFEGDWPMVRMAILALEQQAI